MRSLGSHDPFWLVTSKERKKKNQIEKKHNVRKAEIWVIQPQSKTHQGQWPLPEVRKKEREKKREREESGPLSPSNSLTESGPVHTLVSSLRCCQRANFKLSWVTTTVASKLTKVLRARVQSTYFLDHRGHRMALSFPHPTSPAAILSESSQGWQSLSLLVLITFMVWRGETPLEVQTLPTINYYQV